MKKNMLKNKKKKGFTLIELIAVIAILGILVAIIAPRMMGYTDSAKVSKTKANVKTLLTAIEVYNSTAGDVLVVSGTTIEDLTDATPNNGTSNLDGDKNAIDSLKATANAVVADDAIEPSTTYGNLQNAIKNTVTTYGGIEAIL